MIPKEKANELVEIYKKQVAMRIKDYSLVCKVLDNDMAKQCALIAVNEIINSTHSYQYMLAADLFTRKTFKREYWQEVKQEIEKL